MYFVLNYAFSVIISEYGYNVPVAFSNSLPNQVDYESDNFTFYQVLFFPDVNSTSELLHILVNDDVDSVKCAFYDMDDYFLNLLANESLKYDEDIYYDIVMFSPNKKHIDVLKDSNDDHFDLNIGNIDVSLNLVIKSMGLMHNKFCIIDDSMLVTGSLNPTYNGLNRNNNNVFVINSKMLTENYIEEFNELKQGNEIHKVLHPKINLCSSDDCFMIENYFCPEDSCESNVINQINNASKDIQFYHFSFTSDNIADSMILKSTNVSIQGILEKTQISQYSVKSKLEKFVNISMDNNKYKMHHKVFIIDDSVIMGSYNPTNNGNKYNDENILIIHDSNITSLYLQEFYELLHK